MTSVEGLWALTTVASVGAVGPPQPHAGALRSRRRPLFLASVLLCVFAAVPAVSIGAHARATADPADPVPVDKVVICHRDSNLRQAVRTAGDSRLRRQHRQRTERPCVAHGPGLATPARHSGDMGRHHPALLLRRRWRDEVFRRPQFVGGRGDLPERLPAVDARAESRDDARGREGTHTARLGKVRAEDQRRRRGRRLRGGRPGDDRHGPRRAWHARRERVRGRRRHRTRGFHHPDGVPSRQRDIVARVGWSGRG